MNNILRLSLGLLCTFAIGVKSEAQYAKDATYNEIEHLDGLIQEFMYKHDKKTSTRKEEYILLFLEIDSAGKVTTINMMTDEKNRDFTYEAIKTITPEVLKEWTSKQYNDKVIIFAITSEGSKDSANSYLFHGAYSPIFIPKECSALKNGQDYLFVNKLYYLWPNSGKSH